MAVTDIKSGGMVDWIGSFGNVSRDTWQVKRYKETTWFNLIMGVNFYLFKRRVESQPKGDFDDQTGHIQLL